MIELRIEGEENFQYNGEFNEEKLKEFYNLLACYFTGIFEKNIGVFEEEENFHRKRWFSKLAEDIYSFLEKKEVKIKKKDVKKSLKAFFNIYFRNKNRKKCEKIQEIKRVVLLINEEDYKAVKKIRVSDKTTFYEILYFIISVNGTVERVLDCKEKVFAPVADEIIRSAKKFAKKR